MFYEVIMEGQANIFSYLEQPPRFYEAEWLRAKGFKNIYQEKPPKVGMYEWRDIENPTKGKILEYTGHGIHLGRLAMGNFRPCWWKEIQDEDKSNSQKTG